MEDGFNDLVKQFPTATPSDIYDLGGNIGMLLIALSNSR